MSESSQGPGWWIASDGRWYPPELHPDVRAASPPPRPAEPASDPGWPAPAVDPWIAQARTRAGQPAGGAPASWAATGTATATGTAAATAIRSGSGRRGRGRRVLVVAAAVVVLAGAGIGLALALGGSSPSVGTPQGAAAAALGDLRSGDVGKLCDLALPADQQKCRLSTAFSALFHLTTRNLAVGKVVQQGSEALALVTGTVCVAGGGSAGVPTSGPACETNTDPDAPLDRGQSFAEVYAGATGSGSGQTEESFVFAFARSGGRWYLVAA